MIFTSGPNGRLFLHRLCYCTCDFYCIVFANVYATSTTSNGYHYHCHYHYRYHHLNDLYKWPRRAIVSASF